MIEVRLVLGVRSMLCTEGGLPPEIEREDPRAGGGEGNDTVEGDCGRFRDGGTLTEPNRREGGGGGALPLFDRGLEFSSGGGGVLDSSSGFGDNLEVSGRFVLASGIFWLCRRLNGGAGGGFFRGKEASGDGGSGVLPAASLSNMDSRSESWLARLGAGGKGLLRSVCERGLELK